MMMMQPSLAPHGVDLPEPPPYLPLNNLLVHTFQVVNPLDRGEDCGVVGCGEGEGEGGEGGEDRVGFEGGGEGGGWESQHELAGNHLDAGGSHVPSRGGRGSEGRRVQSEEGGEGRGGGYGGGDGYVQECCVEGAELEED